VIDKGIGCSTDLSTDVSRLLHNNDRFWKEIKPRIYICDLLHGDTVTAHVSVSDVRKFVNADASGNLKHFMIIVYIRQVYWEATC
jgi:hypothetical protein